METRKIEKEAKKLTEKYLSVEELQRRMIGESGRLTVCVFCRLDNYPKNHVHVYNSNGLYIRCENEGEVEA